VRQVAVELVAKRMMTIDELWEQAFETGRLLGVVEGLRQGPEGENMTMFDFQDGNGPIAAHKHPNGGGWVADTAWVSGDARVSE
jgi:hypothetical protein